MLMERLIDWFVSVFNFVYEWVHNIFDIALIVLIAGGIGQLIKSLFSPKKSKDNQK